MLQKKKVGELVDDKKEHFAFPAEKSIQMGFPLAFAITVVFVFIPAGMSANENIRKVA